MDVFRAGITRILESDPVPVIPMALQGLWGSFFSRDPRKGFFRRFWSRVGLVAGELLLDRSNFAIMTRFIASADGCVMATTVWWRT